MSENHRDAAASGTQIDREPTDNEIAMVVEIYRVAEILPVDTALRILMTIVALLVRGSGQSSSLWARIAAVVESQRRWATGVKATHAPPTQVQ